MRIIIAFAMVLFAVVSHAEVTKGTLNAPNGLVLATGAGKVSIPKGNSQIGIDTDFNLFSMNDVILVVNGKTFNVPVPTHIYKSFKKHGNFKISAWDLKTNFGMTAVNTSSLIKKVNEQQKKDCTYCGYCFGTNPSTGNYEYGFNSSCNGKRTILAEVSYFKTVYRIDFTDKNGKVVGSFSSVPIVTKADRELKELKSCDD